MVANCHVFEYKTEVIYVITDDYVGVVCVITDGYIGVVCVITDDYVGVVCVITDDYIGVVYVVCVITDDYIGVLFVKRQCFFQYCSWPNHPRTQQAQYIQYAITLCHSSD